MPVDGFENRMTSALLAALSVIGTPPSSWLTKPTLGTGGIPQDSLPLSDATPLLYVQHVSTTPREEGDSFSRHAYTANFVMWMVGTTPAAVNQLKDDVMRAVYGVEGTVAAAFEGMPRVGTYIHRDDMAMLGRDVGMMDVHIDTTTGH